MYSEDSEFWSLYTGVYAVSSTFLRQWLLRSVDKKTHIQAYIRTEEDLHGIKWPIVRPTNTAADTATASDEASTDAPDALVDAPE